MPRLTDEDLTELERTYGPVTQQKCPQCGGELVHASSMGSLEKYVCASPDASIMQHPIGQKGWQAALDHYHASEWYDQHKADPRIVRLVREIRESRLPRQDREDLLKVDTAQDVLLGLLAKLDGVMPPPMPAQEFTDRYREMVLETVVEALRTWGWTEQEGTPA